MASCIGPISGNRSALRKKRQFQKKGRENINIGEQQIALNLHPTAMTDMFFDGDGNQIDFKGYRADCINDFALEYLDNRDKDKPFFIFVSQLDRIIRMTANATRGYKETIDDYKDYPIPDDLTFLKGDYKEMYPDYISAINRLDYNVGRLVDKLKELGIYDDTIIIYTSDHGSHFKLRNPEYKRSCHESASHTPLYYQRRRLLRAEKGEARLSSLIDIPTTLLSWQELIFRKTIWVLT